MSKISFELFGSEVEIVSIVNDSECDLVLEFPSGLSGFVRIGELAERLTDGICVFDLRLLPNAEYTPALFLDNARILLPRLKKTGYLIEIDDCTQEYIRSTSQRERALERYVTSLEERITLLETSVFGTTIL